MVTKIFTDHLNDVTEICRPFDDFLSINFVFLELFHFEIAFSYKHKILQKLHLQLQFRVSDALKNIIKIFYFIIKSNQINMAQK